MEDETKEPTPQPPQRDETSQASNPDGSEAISRNWEPPAEQPKEPPASKPSGIGRFVFLSGVFAIAFLLLAFLAAKRIPMRIPNPSLEKVSFTKSRLANLKTALICFNCDTGKYPFIGKTQSPETTDGADLACLGTARDENVLMQTEVRFPFERLGLEAAKYSKRWKGPYMDSEPGVFMRDAWGNKIRYEYHQKAIYLHSMGADGKADSLSDAIDNGYSGDDLLIMVSKVKF